MYSGEKIDKYFRPPTIWTGWNDAYLEQFETRFTQIKGISPEVVDDVRHVLREFRHNFAVTKLLGEIEEVFRKDLQAHDNLLNVTYVERFFNRMKDEKELYKSNEISDLIDEYESIFSEKLTTNQVARIMTLIRIVEGTPMKIKNSLVNI